MKHQDTYEACACGIIRSVTIGEWDGARRGRALRIHWPERYGGCSPTVARRATLTSGQPGCPDCLKSDIRDCVCVAFVKPAPTPPTAYPDDNPKTAYGVKKPPLSLIPAPAALEMSAVMALGAAKYGRFNWREKTVSSSVYVDAALRHLMSWFDGESTDPESGASHLAHVMACCAIVLDAQAIGKLNDDRPKPAPTADLIRNFAEKKDGAK